VALAVAVPLAVAAALARRGYGDRGTVSPTAE
jgi:hypothetical protein